MPNDLRFTAAATLRRSPSFHLLNSSRCHDLMGPTYTQHNAYVAGGIEGFRQFTAAFKHSSIVRVFADSDYVSTSIGKRARYTRRGRNGYFPFG